MPSPPIETAFYETVRALGQDHLNNLVIVGGWCPFLYAKHVWRRQAPQLLTMDLDFAVKKMSPDRFSGPVYKKLIEANLIPRKMDMEDDYRVQFSYLAEKILVPIEFITSPTVLPRGQKPQTHPYVACDPVPEVSIALLTPPLIETIHYAGEKYHLPITAPAAFILMKALLLEHRINSIKIPKDLASIAFVVRYCPDLKPLLAEMGGLMKFPEAREGAKILARALVREKKTGYPWLRPFYKTWGVDDRRVSDEIQTTFAPLLETLRKQKLTKK